MNDDLLSEKKAFDDSKAGLKGLVDAGIVDIPRIFIRPPDELAQDLSRCRLQEASEKWGFFQLINHEVPSSVMEGMIDGIRRFHEQDVELKKEYYSRDREALGLNTDCLKSMECAKGKTLVCHYYSACPQPELTLGTDKHTDPDFLTILLQDQSGGAL
ncbi:Deacetoxyvindoline 4-hydroxylase [Capsicum chinense]|nr:Deacetoxyvindoline 4-hydroxylase [Capsicum chinense]